jgi:prepilin-type N-terminal cleavage/methylation domain-containing protein
VHLTRLREKRVRGEQGFTLIELLVVVVIIDILIARAARPSLTAHATASP